MALVLGALVPVFFHLFQIKHLRAIVPAKLVLPLTVGMTPCVFLPLAATVTTWAVTATDRFLEAWTYMPWAGTATEVLFSLVSVIVYAFNPRHELVAGTDTLGWRWRAALWLVAIGVPSTILSAVIVVSNATIVDANNVPTAIGLCLGRVQTLSMLFLIYAGSGQSILSMLGGGEQRLTDQAVSLFAGEAELEAIADTGAQKWIEDGETPYGILVNVSTLHQVVIDREGPLARVKLGGLQRNMAPYLAGPIDKVAFGRRDPLFLTEDDP